MGLNTEQFVEKVDENLICGICLAVLEDPWQCKDGHTFCKYCITRCLETKQMCPMGNSKLRVKDLARSLVVKNIVSNLEVYCHPPGSDGQAEAKEDAEECKLKCDWTGRLQSLVRHREACPFQQVQCPNVNCNTNMQRRELEDHDKICEYKELECDEQCGVTLIRRDLPNHKINDCPEVILACPNGCETSIKRNNINTHRETCPSQQVECPNVNCNTNMQRRELEDHDKTCEYKVVECDKCREALVRLYLKFHKNVFCPEEMVQCLNSCKSPETGQINNMKRMKLNEHLDNVCAKTILDCPFKDQGCLVQVERQHMDKHVQDNMAAHMMLLAKQCSSLTKQNSSLTEQNTTLTEQCSALKQRVRSLTVGNHLLKDEVKKNDESSRTYIWKIRNYHDSFLQADGSRGSTGQSFWPCRDDAAIKLISPTFWLCGHSWFLLLYPNGHKHNRGFVSVRLYKDSDNYRSEKSASSPRPAKRKKSSINEIQTPSTDMSITCRLSMMSQKPGCPNVSSEKTDVLSSSWPKRCVIQWPKLMRSVDVVSEAYCVRQDTETATKHTHRNKDIVTIQCTIQLDKTQ